MEVDGVRIDEIYTGTNIEDDGRFGDGETVANVPIYLSPKVNFDIRALMQEDFTICMKDGMCAGREFKVAGCTKEKDGSWKLMIERKPDSSLDLYFPYNDFQIKKGDHFVLTGIELPDAYVEAASEKLLKYCIAYLDKNDYTRYVYQPKVDEIFMARQHDAAMADSTGLTKSLYMSLKEGDIMLFKDDDLGIDAEITIDQLTIKEEDGKIPTYEITLREEKEVGTIQKIQNQISSIADGNGINVTNGSSTANQIKDLALAEARTRFLSKLSDDYASGIITFLQGLVSEGAITANGGIDFGQFITGLFGTGGRIDAQGHGELRSLRLWEWLEVPEIRFNKITVNIGLSIRSEGGGIIETAIPDLDEGDNQLATGSAYLKLEDGEYGAIAVDDLCMGIWHDFGGGNATENSDDKQGTIQIRGFKTIYFWITDIPKTDPEGKDNSDQHFFRYQVRSSSNGGNDIHPVNMLHFAQRGNTSDTERQHIVFSTTKYTIKLHNLSTWNFSPSTIYDIDGVLDGFSMEQVGADGQTYVKHFQGTGHVVGNAYIYGQIEKFERVGYRLIIEQSYNGSIAPSETETETCRVFNGYGEDVTYMFKNYSIVRDSGDPSSDGVWNAQHTNLPISGVPFEFEISFNDLGIRSSTQISTMFTVTVSDEAKEATAEQSIIFN